MQRDQDVTWQELVEILPVHLHRFIAVEDKQHPGGMRPLTHEDRKTIVVEAKTKERYWKWEQARAIAVEVMAALQAGDRVREAAQGWGIHPSTALRLASLARVWRQPDITQSFRLYQALFDLAKLETSIARPISQTQWNLLMVRCESLLERHVMNPADGIYKSAQDIEEICASLRQSGDSFEMTVDLDGDTGEILGLEGLFDVDEYNRPIVELRSGKRHTVTLKEILERNGIANTRVRVRIEVNPSRAEGVVGERLDAIRQRARQQELEAYADTTE